MQAGGGDWLKRLAKWINQSKDQRAANRLRGAVNNCKHLISLKQAQSIPEPVRVPVRDPPRYRYSSEEQVSC
jgi:hypothetical protein